jgi:hypothetical protein
LKILESGPDKLVSRAQQAVDEMEDKNEEELKDIGDKIQFNKSYIQRCPDKTSGDKTSGDKTSGDKTSSDKTSGDKRPATKRLWKKTSGGTKRPGEKTSGRTKRPGGQNIQKDKTFVGTKCPRE